MQADLASLMAEAAQDVNAYRDRTGHLPDRLPNPALAMLVKYQRDGDTQYTLNATLGQITLEQRH